MLLCEYHVARDEAENEDLQADLEARGATAVVKTVTVVDYYDVYLFGRRAGSLLSIQAAFAMVEQVALIPGQKEG